MMWTDNPVRDAERWAAEQEEKVERLLPVCQACGRKIREKYCYWFDQDDIETCFCQDCVKKQTQKLSGVLEDFICYAVDEYFAETPLREAE